MIVLAASVLERAEATLGEALPRLAGALLLVIVGLPIVILLSRFVRRMLLVAGLDDLGERSGVHDGLSRLGLERSLSRLIARGVRIALIVLVMVAAISLLGFGALAAGVILATQWLRLTKSSSSCRSCSSRWRS